MFLRVGILVTIIVSYAMTMIPCCTALHRLLFDEDKATNPRRRWHNAWESLAITIIAVTLALLIADISIIFGLFGSTTSVVNLFFLPIAFFLKCVKKEKRKAWEVFGCVVLGLVGVLIFVVST
jgi:Transmembrane amino acid transporter protein/5TM C-terminal transporter carbon starvation CstA